MESNIPSVIISGFADEISVGKDLDQQLSVIAALGMQYFSIRFLSINGIVKNTVDLTDAEVVLVKSKMAEYGVHVSSLGSPIGKVKLLDTDDGSANRFVPWSSYLSDNVRRACEIACQLETKLIRAFSFYHPQGTDARRCLAQATDQLGEMTTMVDQYGLILGLEVEANLVGHTAEILADIYRGVNHPKLVLIFDGANLVTQGFDSQQVFQQYLLMKPGLGCIHIKDYSRDQSQQVGSYVNEAALARFVPVGSGDSAYDQVLLDLARDGDSVFDRIRDLGLPGLFVDLEPHLRAGGQFGGFSGADGFGVAFRSLLEQLDQSGLRYQLRDMTTIHEKS